MANRCLNDTVMSVPLIFHNVWTKVRKQEDLRKFFVSNNGKPVVVIHQVAPLCIQQLLKMKFTEQQSIEVCQKLWKMCRCFKRFI